MRPGPVFILTFRAGLYRCPSSDLKGRYGLGGLPQRCQTSPSSSAACDIFTSTEYAQPVPPVRSRYTPSPSVPITTWRPEARWRWWRCQQRTPAMSRDFVPPDLFHWQQRRKQVIIWPRTGIWVVTQYGALTKVPFIQRKCAKAQQRDYRVKLLQMVVVP